MLLKTRFLFTVFFPGHLGRDRVQVPAVYSARQLVRILQPRNRRLERDRPPADGQAGRPRRGLHDHQLRPRDRHRLHEALHESWDQHLVQGSQRSCH